MNEPRPAADPIPYASPHTPPPRREPEPPAPPKPITRRLIIILAAIVAGSVLLGALIVVGYFSHQQSRQEAIEKATITAKEFSSLAGDAEMAAVESISKKIRAGNPGPFNSDMLPVYDAYKASLDADTDLAIAKGEQPPRAWSIGDEKHYLDLVMQEAKARAGK